MAEKETLLDLDRLPTLEEMQDFFKENDWSAAKIFTEPELADAEFIREYAGNTAVLEARCDALPAEMNAIIEQTQNLIGENASVAMDQKVYAERYRRLVADYDSKKADFDSL